VTLAVFNLMEWDSYQEILPAKTELFEKTIAPRLRLGIPSWSA